MRTIPTPAEIPGWNLSESETHGNRVSRILDEFLTAVRTNDFNVFSTDERKVVFFPAEADYTKAAAFDEAVERLKARGWKVSWDRHISAMGWFNAIFWTP